MKVFITTLLCILSTSSFSQVIGTSDIPEPTRSAVWDKYGELKHKLILEGRKTRELYSEYELVSPKGMKCAIVVATGINDGTKTRVIPKGTRFKASYVGQGEVPMRALSLGLKNGVWETQIIPKEPSENFHLFPEDIQEDDSQNKNLWIRCNSDKEHKPVVVYSKADIGLTRENSDQCQTYSTSERVWAYRQNVSYYACRNFDDFFYKYESNSQIASVEKKRVLTDIQLRSFIDSYIE
jgi:hypothetical protein